MAKRRSQLAAEAWASLLHAHATLVPRMAKELQRATGLPLSWYDVLIELAEAPEGMLTMSELGERVVLSRTRVSRIVDDLGDAGLVAKQANADDGRSAFAVLTAEGKARYRAAAPRYLAIIEREFGDRLSSVELEVIASALAKAIGPVPVRGEWPIDAI